MGEIIRRHGHANAVSRQHPNVMTPHAPRQLGSYQRATLINLDGVLATALGILNDALHFQ